MILLLMLVAALWQRPACRAWSISGRTIGSRRAMTWPSRHFSWSRRRLLVLPEVKGLPERGVAQVVLPSIVFRDASGGCTTRRRDIGLTTMESSLRRREQVSVVVVDGLACRGNISRPSVFIVGDRHLDRGAGL
ncbi:hypothetical protein [Nocardia asteroides]|uniref:hypothetical protein n=1 Tax=Nocardia asteroides TaxID=1824 RepID=UPI003649D7D6